MNTPKPQIIDESGDKYKYGFVTDIEAETVPKAVSYTHLTLPTKA